MERLLQLDISFFRFIHERLANPFLDTVMPFASGNAFFMPTALLACLLIIWRGRVRGLVCVMMLLLTIAIGDGFINPTLKRVIGRPRPPQTQDIGDGQRKGSQNPSMPSSHAANWFSAALVFFVYYRRSAWVTLPLAATVSFSRVYNGLHYPSDVLVGAILGAGYAAATLVALQSLWTAIGKRWFPFWWERFPSLLVPEVRPLPEETEEEPEFAPRDPTARAACAPRHEELEKQWLRIGYLLIAVCLLARLLYIAGDTIELSEDEAYQWTWSKHLALSYYSKPPLIAYTQFLGTLLWGDTAFGVRFFAPIISSLIGLLLLRFFAREINARAAVFLLLALSSTLLMSVGSVLMTIDPLSVLFWTAAMIAGWRAAQPHGKTVDWFWVGLWMGLGFLSKYTQLFQWLCWVVFFILWKPARKHLLRPGPWLALLTNIICMIPVALWNAQHDWITLTHLSDRAGTDKPWTPTLTYLGEFLGAEFLLLNPVFFVGMIWACVAFWRKGRHNPKLAYFFSMGAPLFLAYLLFSLRGRVLPNWIAPSVVPLFCLMAAFWDSQWRLGGKNVRRWFEVGLLIGIVTVVIGHDSKMIERVTKIQLPTQYDPMRRVREWSLTAKEVGKARDQLLKEGKPVFIIADHYGLVGEISFYLPEAKATVKEDPLVYYQSAPHPRNQYWFWPGYTNRSGENAIFVRETNRRTGETKPAPIQLEAQFESVSDIGTTDIGKGRKVTRQLQLFECRNLK